MATFLDIGLLEHFKIIFPILFTFLVVYALLVYTKFLGDNKAIHALIAFALSIMVAFSDIAVATINSMAPWLVLVFIFIIFGLLAYKSIGFSDAQIMGALTARRQRWIIFIIGWVVVAIFLGSLTSEISERGGIGVYGVSNTTEASSGDDETQEKAFYETLVHPKVLGIMFILLLMLFAINRLVVTSD